MYLQLHIYFSDWSSLNQAMLLFSHQVVSNSCDPMNCSMPGFPVPHHLPEFAQVHVHWISDAIQPSDVKAETPILLVTWCEELTHLKRPWCWERLRAGGEGDDRGWDGWMASSIQPWTNLGELQELVMDREAWRAKGLQRVRHDWATELNWSCYETRSLFVALSTLVLAVRPQWEVFRCPHWPEFWFFPILQCHSHEWNS